MPVLLAPDKFKGSLSAERVADHLQAGMKRTATDASFDWCPIADGGEGTVDAVQLDVAGFAKVFSLLDIEPDVGQCHAQAGEILETIGARIGSAWCRPARPDPVGVTMWSRYCGPEI